MPALGENSSGGISMEYERSGLAPPSQKENAKSKQKRHTRTLHPASAFNSWPVPFHSLLQNLSVTSRAAYPGFILQQIIRLDFNLSTYFKKRLCRKLKIEDTQDFPFLKVMKNLEYLQ